MAEEKFISNMDSEKLKTGVEFLKSCHFQPDDIMVCGSMALKLMGLLPPGRDVHDIDLMVKTDDETWKCMRLVEAIMDVETEEPGECVNPDGNGYVPPIIKECECECVKSGIGKKKRKYYPDGDFLTFNIGETVLNVWKTDSIDSRLSDSETGVMIRRADIIFDKKKSYGRNKDFKDISEICSNILKWK